MDWLVIAKISSTATLLTINLFKVSADASPIFRYSSITLPKTVSIRWSDCLLNASVYLFCTSSTEPAPLILPMTISVLATWLDTFMSKALPYSIACFSILSKIRLRLFSLFA